MGANKGKGAANLRRINTQKAQERKWERSYLKMKEMGLPDVSFNTTPTYVHIAKPESLK